MVADSPHHLLPRPGPVHQAVDHARGDDIAAAAEYFSPAAAMQPLRHNLKISPTQHITFGNPTKPSDASIDEPAAEHVLITYLVPAHADLRAFGWRQRPSAR
ncbi:hypothetical protein IU476_34765 [Nocardia blacklockiae]|nr:hypothetical protein [Nocardia blacklockiae]